MMNTAGGMEESIGKGSEGRAMNILLIPTLQVKPEDVLETTRELNVTLSVAKSREEAMEVIVATSIDAVIFTLRTFEDLELLNYLNRTYPQLHVLLMVGKTTGDIISILKDGRYQVLPASFRVSDLKHFLETITVDYGDGKAQAIT